MHFMSETPPDNEDARYLVICRPIRERYQTIIDHLNPHIKTRWCMTLALMMLYILRIYCIQGFHIITYALAIYILSLFISSITPQVDPEYADMLGETPTLPRTEAEEFRPFIPRLLEATFWHCTTRAIIISIICTFIPLFDIPVFWPILVMYFILLFTVMMKRQIKHMITHRYMPFSYGKPHHGDGKKVLPAVIDS